MKPTSYLRYWTAGWLVWGLALSFRLASAPLPASSPEDQGVDAGRLGHMHALVKSYIDQGNHAGAVAMIVRNGHIIDTQAWGHADLAKAIPMRRDHIFRIYSMSKVVTSVAALQLFEQGRILLDSPVTQWLPELGNVRVFAGGTAENPQTTPATNAITVRMLLNHTGGFTYGFFSGSPVNELYVRADLWNSTSLDDFMERASRLPLLAQPGTAYNYGIGNDVLGVLIERVSGMPFDAYVARHITGPLGMVDTAFHVPKDKQDRVAAIHRHGTDGGLETAEPILGSYMEPGRGIAAGGAGLFSTIDDYARFAQCLLNGGTLDGARILGRKTVELARENTLPPGEFAFMPSEGWGLFSALRMDRAGSLEPASEGMFYWSGAATTHFFVDPAENLIGLVFAQHIPFDEHQLFARFRITIYQALQ